MIKSRDVITLKLPFPSKNSVLALSAHMYICEKCDQNNYCLIKCQTYKNSFYKLKNYVIEHPSQERNPFRHISLIDCDKRFNLKSVSISEDILTKKRRDISSDLFTEIKNKIDEENCVNNSIDRNALISLNRKVKLV